MQLDIEQIRLDGGTQPRAAYHFGLAEAYAEDMQAGAVFPPVTVFYDGADYWLADGFHRVLAAEKLDQPTIDADVRQGTQQDAQWYSYSVNLAHGLRRSNDDKRRAVVAALAHPRAAEMSDHQIAAHVGVSQPFVSGLRNRVTDNNYQSTGNGYRAGKDGVKRKTPKSSKPKRQPAPAHEPEEEARTETPTSDASAPDVAAIVDELVYRFPYDVLCLIHEELGTRIAVNA